jgi:hypothetical protein
VGHALGGEEASELGAIGAIGEQAAGGELVDDS